MKNILIWLILLLVGVGNSFGQVDPVTGQYSDNGNLLISPGFESGLKPWVNSLGAFTQESVEIIKGKKSGKVVLSSQALTLYQDSTQFASQFAGSVQGLASVRVKTSVSGLKVCSRSAGVTSTSNCVDVQANNKWGLYKVPFILGATSNGVSINSNSVAVSGTIYVDDAFVGAASLTQNMNACNDVSCETEFSAKISSAGATSDENLDWISASSGTSTYTVTFTANTFAVAPNCTAISDANNALIHVVISSISASSITVLGRRTDNGGAIASGFHLVCQKQGTDFTAAKQLSNGNTYSSTNADTDWASCGHVPADFTGFGTVSAIETQCKREGSDLLMRGKFTSGVSTAVEARIALKLGGVSLTSASSSSIPSIQIAGVGGRAISSVTESIYTLIEPSVAYITFGDSVGTQAALTKITGLALISNGNFLSFNARIPISGWQNSNIIIGQFNGLESCTDSYECTDTFSAKVSSTGVVSDENIDWINGSCSNPTAGKYDCTFKTSLFSVAPNCIVTVEDATTSSELARLYSVSSTVASINTIIPNSAQANSAFQIICQKQGVDFVSKTAKAVASDQNLKSDVVKGAIYSWVISPTGVVTKEIGNPVNGNCTNASNTVCTFTTDLWASDPVCQCSATTSGKICNISSASETASSVTLFRYSDAGGSESVEVRVTCHGVVK